MRSMPGLQRTMFRRQRSRMRVIGLRSTYRPVERTHYSEQNLGSSGIKQQDARRSALWLTLSLLTLLRTSFSFIRRCREYLPWFIKLSSLIPFFSSFPHFTNHSIPASAVLAPIAKNLSTRAIVPASCASTLTPACVQAMYNLPINALISPGNLLAISGFDDVFPCPADLQVSPSSYHLTFPSDDRDPCQSALAIFRPDLVGSTFTTESLDDSNPSVGSIGLEAVSIPLRLFEQV